MEKIYAIIENGIVANLAVAEGPWPFPAQTVIDVTGGHPVTGAGVCIGWQVVDGKIIDPTPVGPAVPTIPVTTP